MGQVLKKIEPKKTINKIIDNMYVVFEVYFSASLDNTILNFHKNTAHRKCKNSCHSILLKFRFIIP